MCLKTVSNLKCILNVSNAICKNISKKGKKIINRYQEGKHLGETFALQLSPNYLLIVCETFSSEKASSWHSKAGKGHYSVCNFLSSDNYLVTISYHIAILCISQQASTFS